MADDLVDEASSEAIAGAIIEECNHLLITKFAHPFQFRENLRETAPGLCASLELIDVIDNLPVSRLTIQPLQSLLEGFRTDLKFSTQHNIFPIENESDLDCYSYRVASTVARCILDLIFHHFPTHPSAVDTSFRRDVVFAAEQMGKALQYVNVARDIGRDAAIKRVYLPTTWLKEVGLSQTDVIFCPSHPRLKELQSRLLDRAGRFFDNSEAALECLPTEVQGPLRATVANYMEIGTVLKEGTRPRRPWQKLKLSFGRRFLVAYAAMSKVSA